MPLIEQIAPAIYCIPSARSIMYTVRAGVGVTAKSDSDRDHQEVVEDARWGRLGDLFEQGLGRIAEAVRNRQDCSGMIYPKENWHPGDRDWLVEQARNMGIEVQIGPQAQQAGWHSNTPWIIFRWTDLHLKAQRERSDQLSQRKPSR